MVLKLIRQGFTKLLQYSERKVAIGSLLVALIAAIATGLQAVVIINERTTPYKTVAYQQQIQSVSQILVLSRKTWASMSVLKDLFVAEHYPMLTITFRAEAQRVALSAYMKNYEELQFELTRGVLILPSDIYVTAKRLVDALGEPINVPLSGTMLQVDADAANRSLKKASSEYASFANASRGYFGVDRLSGDIQALLSFPPAAMLSVTGSSMTGMSKKK
jgi:hypothetical protein